MALDYALEPEQEALVRTIRAFAQRELAPHSARWDRDRIFPAEAWRQMGALGLLGLRVPAGEKSGISLGMAAHAVIVFARTGEAGARGVTAFLVPLDLPGVARSPLRDMGSHAIARAVLAFDHVRIPASYRLGEEGTGFYEVMRGFDFNRALISLAGLGAAQISLEETMAYVKERQAFGRPLAHFEGVTFPIAEAATWIEAARGLCLRALRDGARDR